MMVSDVVRKFYILKHHLRHYKNRKQIAILIDGRLYRFRSFREFREGLKKYRKLMLYILNEAMESLGLEDRDYWSDYA